MANPIVTITMENGDVIKAELYTKIAPNTVNNFISLVKKGYYDGLNSAGSQFFIMHKAAPHLDGEYAAFGKVIEGMDVVDKIASVKTFMDYTYEKQVMASVTVDTQGEEYPEPEKIEK